MELRRLRHFVAVMEVGSVGAAARRVGLTQQALSSSVAQLEDSLGIELFERTSRGMVPNLYARHLLRHARHLLEDSAHATASLKALRTAASGEVRLGISETMAGAPAATVLERVLRRMPGITVSMNEAFSEQLIELLLNGQIDLALGSPAASWLGHPDLVAEPVLAVRETVVARAGHPLAQRGRVTLRDLQAATWIQGRFLTESYEALCQAFVGAGLAPPQRIIWSDALASGLALMLRNDFVAFICSGLFAHEIERGTLVELRAEAPRRERLVYLIRRRRFEPTPAIETMIEDLREMAAEPGSGFALNRAAPALQG